MNYIYVVCGVVILILAGLLGLDEHRITGLNKNIATMVQADKDKTKQFNDDAARQKKEYEDAEIKARATAAAEIAQRDASIARLIAAGNGLQHTIDNYASGVGTGLPQAGTSGPTADDRAKVLGELLGSCLSVARQSAIDAESLAGQVRYFQSRETVAVN